ncbi:MAG: ABC transporter substrate-binding protein [Thermoplasmata archaeon]
MLKKAIVVIAAIALLLALGAALIPRHAAAQLNGGWVSEIVFSVVPQDQAVSSLSSGDTHMYIFTLDDPSDRIAAQNDPNIYIQSSFGGSRGFISNPVAPNDGSFSPFTIREIREAIHWAVDRQFVVDEIAGGFAIPMTHANFAVEPGYVQDAAFMAALDAEYAYNPARAKAQVDGAMGKVAGSSFDAATNKWLVNGNEVEVTIIHRIEDFRFEIGEYLATEVEALGFTPTLKPLAFIPAITEVYFTDAKLGTWDMYTEGWGSGGFVQFDDTTGQFWFNGDLGSAIWDDHSPGASVDVPCTAVFEGNYVSIDERQDLIRDCYRAGMKDGVRGFILADQDTHAYNNRVSDSVFNVFSGNQNPWVLHTARLDNQEGGSLRVAQPVHTGSGWNHYGGYDDVYSVYQHWAYIDHGVATHPHLGVAQGIRADFDVTSVGPLGTMAVPDTALWFNLSSNAFEAVGPGLESQTYVDFTFTYGEWHHGQPITMDDINATLAMISRVAEGDISAVNPFTSNLQFYALWAEQFRAFEYLADDSIRVWYNFFNPDISLAATFADVWALYPWELTHIMATSVLLPATDPSATALSDTDATAIGVPEADLAKGATFAAYDILLAADVAANTQPAYLTTPTGGITPAEATARWAALDEWRNPAAGGCTDGPSIWNCNYMVSNGPYILDQYFTAPEGALYTAKRTGYPFDINKWDNLAEIRLPEVTIGTPPQVVQTFPAIFGFTTSLNQQSYDLIQTAAWLVTDPATRQVLFTGDAVRVGPGQWEAQLSADQTTALVEGTYTLQTIIVGEEAALPVVNTQSFTSLSLASSIVAEVTQIIDEALIDFQDTIDENTAATQAAVDSANAAASLANTVLIVAIVGIVIAVVAVALAVVWGRKGTM